MYHLTDKIAHTTAFVTPVVEHKLEREIAQWVHPMKDQSDDPSHHERTLLPQSYISLLHTKEGHVSFNNILKTFYLQFGIRHSERTIQQERKPTAATTWAARDILYTPSHRQDTQHLFTSRGALAVMRNSPMVPP